LVGALLGVGGAGATSAASSQYGPLIEFWDGTSWTQQASPNPDGTGELSAVAAISATDVWAVGAYGRLLLPYGGAFALAEHWDGTTWEQVPMPTPSRAAEVRLYAAAATSATDVWAVGSWAGTSYHTLIEHWDGNSWTIVPSPPRRGSAQLYGVEALSPTDVWAVGYYRPHVGRGRTLTLHWNGKGWKEVGAPRLRGHDPVLSGVAAVSPRSIWAVGGYFPGPSGHRSSFRTLVLHWNGKKWGRVRSPTPGVSGQLSAVTAVGPNNLWAVGGYRSGHGPRALAEHWNGHSWRVISARVGTDAQGLTNLAVVSSRDIWGAGTYDLFADRTLSAHWDGNTWSKVPSPNPVADECNHFSAIAAAGPKAVWAVGSFYLGD
jgi:hypothetical protein